MIFSKALKYACAVALVIAAGVVPAAARTAFPAEGGQGNTARPIECGDDEYLVGFAGRVGSWIDRLQPLCAKVLSDGHRDSINDKIKAAGGKGGSPAEFSCPADSFISSASFSTFKGQGRYLADVTFTCYRPRDGQTLPDKVRFGAGTGDVFSSKKHTCPFGEIGTGVNLRYGVHVNAFGLICDTLYIPKGAPVASSKTKPAPATSTASSGPPLMTTLSFSGSWKTVTSENRQYTLVLNPVIPGTLIPGRAIQFTGQFVSADGARQYNGQLQGSSIYPSPVLNFTYVQPGLEAAGTGVFTLSSDGQLNGTAVHMSKEKFAWNGGRNAAPPAPAAPAGSKVSSTSSSSGTSTPPATSTLEEQTDRPGDDYSQTVSDDPVRCRAKCLKDKSCAAWTWVQPGVQGDKGQCYLKDRVPSARPGDCCVSGVITR